jgi:phosphatidate cytidylyltransferase
MVQQEAEKQKGILYIRLISAVILAPTVLLIVYIGTPFFEILVGLAALIMAQEWKKLCNNRVLWLLVGFLYISLPCLALLSLRANPTYGKEILFWLLSIVWAADTGAYIFGRLIGGRKLAPIISPNKTWAGLIGGIILAAFIGSLMALLLKLGASISLLSLSAFIGALSQVGDLVESWFKRYFEVKDTGSIIPGHGGLLDRVDGLIVAAFIVFMIDVLSQDGIFTWI